ncbi:hypothetical protein ACODYM_28830 [Burkholderia gladioli]|uniref:hypothetical protein n=1 Tax=Burkholderia gladioli TaxID=28095 RepID=UPI003B50D361
MSKQEKKIEQGTTIYDLNGRSGDYVACTPDGHVVRPVYEYANDGEVYYGSPEIWRDAFLTPPVEKLHAEVAELNEAVAKARASLNAVSEERRAADREYAARADFRKQHAQLKKLDDFIAGRITHFVVTEEYGAPHIQEFKSFITTNDRYDKKLRLLSLYGDSKGNLNWNLDRYSDGSGDHWRSGNAAPATSYEEAVEMLAVELEKRYVKARANDSRERGQVAAYVTVSQKHGLVVPDDIAAMVREDASAARFKAIAAAETRITDAQADLRKLQETA